MFTSVTTGKTQADGAFTVALGSYDKEARHQIQVEVSSAPEAGTLAVAVRSPGATDFVTLDGSFDLTGADLLKTVGPMYVAEFQFTPSDFDADKTYNVIVTSGDD